MTFYSMILVLNLIIITLFLHFFIQNGGHISQIQVNFSINVQFTWSNRRDPILILTTKQFLLGNQAKLITLQVTHLQFLRRSQAHFCINLQNALLLKLLQILFFVQSIPLSCSLSLYLSKELQTAISRLFLQIVFEGLGLKLGLTICDFTFLVRFHCLILIKN